MFHLEIPFTGRKELSHQSLFLEVSLSFLVSSFSLLDPPSNSISYSLSLIFSLLFLLLLSLSFYTPQKRKEQSLSQKKKGCEVSQKHIFVSLLLLKGCVVLIFWFVVFLSNSYFGYLTIFFFHYQFPEISSPILFHDSNYCIGGPFLC